MTLDPGWKTFFEILFLALMGWVSDPEILSLPNPFQKLDYITNSQQCCRFFSFRTRRYLPLSSHFDGKIYAKIANFET